MPDLTVEKLESALSQLWADISYEPSREEILAYEKINKRWDEYSRMNQEERLAFCENVKLKDYCQKRLDFYWSRKLGMNSVEQQRGYHTVR